MNDKLLTFEEVSEGEFEYQEDSVKSDSDLKADLWNEALKEDPSSFITVNQIQGSGNMPEAYINRFPVEKYDYGQVLEYLRENHGHGDYRIRLYVKGRLRKGGIKVVSIAKQISKKPESSGNQDMVGVMTELMSRMEASNRQLILAVTQGNRGGDKKAWLEELLTMKTLFGGGRGETAVNGVDQLRDSIVVLKELGVSVGGIVDKDDDDIGFGGLVEKFSPLIEKLITQPDKKEPKLTQDSKEKRMNTIQKIALKAQLEPFIKASIKRSDPEVYAEMIVDQVDEDVIKNYLTPENAFSELVKVDARIGENRDWFLLLIEHVKAQLGMDSTVAHLYEDSEGDIDSQSSLDNSENDS